MKNSPPVDIKQVLECSPFPLTPREIGEDLDMTPEYVRGWLLWLRQVGMVETVAGVGPTRRWRWKGRAA